MLKIFNKLMGHNREDFLEKPVLSKKNDNGEQVLKDWRREGKNIYINGVSLSEIFAKENLQEKVKKEEMSKKDLEEVWKKYLLPSGFTDTQKTTMLKHMFQFMHQGGYNNMLQAALYKDAFEKGIALVNDKVKRRLSISVCDNKILMKEHLEVMGLRRVDNPENLVRNNNEENPLMIADGEYELVFDSKEQPSCVVKKVTLEHHSNITSGLFDERSVFEKIRQFLFNLKEFFFPSQQPQAPEYEEKTESPRLGP